MDSSREFEFTRDDFDYLRKIVTSTTGILAGDDKYTMYYSRLARRVRKLGLKDFKAYRQYLEQNRESESIELVNSVTTNLTAFFRENHHFDYLKETLVPALRKAGGRSIRGWSAGCSTGEEPYSIMMALHEALPDIKQWDVHLLATDIDSNVLNHGANGVYKEARVQDLEPQRLRRFFRKGKGENAGLVRVIPELREGIEFAQLNLLEKWPAMDRLDFIFCRNVVIYFDKPTKTRLVERYAEQLKPEGVLFMGHSESLYKSTDRFELLGKTIYRKSRKS